MERSDKTDQAMSTDQAKARAVDAVRTVGKTVKNELSDTELQDVNGGCCSGQHMPTTI